MIVTHEMMQKTFEGLLKTFDEKNSKYGNSFEKSVDRYGLIAALTRMSDKWNRLENMILLKADGTDDENLQDTLLDLANYCAMTATMLKDVKPHNWAAEFPAVNEVVERCCVESEASMLAPAPNIKLKDEAPSPPPSTCPSAYPEDWTNVTPEQFAHRLRDIGEAFAGDEEESHAMADRALCDMLTVLGYGEGVRVYDELDKWYV